MQRRFDIPPGGELHVHLSVCDERGAPTGPLRLTLTQAEGDTVERSAEFFGAAMAVGVPVIVDGGSSAAVYSAGGCTIVAEGSMGDLNGLYVDSLAAGHHRSLAEIHHSLSLQRRRAKQEGGRVGPCVLVCGATSDSGKSSVAKTLVNYAVCLGYHPLFVDMATAAPTAGAPGCISVFNVQYPLTDELSAQCVPCQHVYVGDAAASPAMFRGGVDCAMALVENRWEEGDRVLLGGLVADYPMVDPSDAEALEQLRATIEQCRIDTLVIVGPSTLRHRLLAAYDEGGGAARGVLALGGGQEVALVCLEEAHGAARRNKVARDAMIARYWRTYFYGTQRVPITPTEITVPHSAISILRVVAAGDERGLSTMRSLDHAEEAPTTEVVAVRPTELRPGTLLGLADSCFEVCDGLDPHHPEAVFTAIDTEEVYRNLQESRRLLGFVLLASATSTTATLLSACGALPQPRGCCFVVCGGPSV